MKYKKNFTLFFGVRLHRYLRSRAPAQDILHNFLQYSITSMDFYSIDSYAKKHMFAVQCSTVHFDEHLAVNAYGTLFSLSSRRPRN